MREACAHREAFQAQPSECPWHLVFVVRWAPDWGGSFRGVAGSGTAGHHLDAGGLRLVWIDLGRQVSRLEARRLDDPDRIPAVRDAMEISDPMVERPQVWARPARRQRDVVWMEHPVDHAMCPGPRDEPVGPMVLELRARSLALQQPVLRVTQPREFPRALQPWEDALHQESQQEQPDARARPRGVAHPLGPALELFPARGRVSPQLAP
jgi:hypothetical protein